MFEIRSNKMLANMLLEKIENINKDFEYFERLRGF